MDDNFSSILKSATRRFSRKGSYDIRSKAPSFKVKALLSDGISVADISNESSNQAVDMALDSVGSLDQKNKQDVIIKISIKSGVEVISKKTKKTIHTYKIHQVGYCNVDKRYPHFFVFIAAKEQSNLQCHVFMCDDLAKSRAICLTFAKTFQNSFSNWQKSKEMSTPDMNSTKGVNRRRSAANVQIPSRKQLEKRRASDFVTTGGLKRLNIRRSSADAVHHSSDEESESFDDEANQAYEDILSHSVENGTRSLLRRGSTDWDAIAEDKEVQRKMEGDLIVWE